MVKIIVADDHKIFREAICNMLNTTADLEIVGEAENGSEAITLARELHPDVIIMDISMTEMNGIEATQSIVSECPEIKIIALSIYADKRYIMGMLKAGVAGYLIKDCAFQELTEAISVVCQGETYLSPKITETVRKALFNHNDEHSTSFSDNLTKRERQVLQLLAEGTRTRDIADILCVSVKTIETYRSSIMQKLNLHSIAELTKYAVREGLTPLEK